MGKHYLNTEWFIETENNQNENQLFANICVFEMRVKTTVRHWKALWAEWSGIRGRTHAKRQTALAFSGLSATKLLFVSNLMIIAIKSIISFTLTDWWKIV